MYCFYYPYVECDHFFGSSVLLPSLVETLSCPSDQDCNGLIGANESRLTAYKGGTSNGGHDDAAFLQMRLFKLSLRDKVKVISQFNITII